MWSDPTVMELDQLDGAGVFRPRGRRGAESDPAARCATERAAAEAVERGWKAGHAAGWQAGFEQATAAAARDVGRALASLSAAAEELRRRSAVDLAEAEDAIVAGAIELAGLIISHEVAAAADPGADAIARALSLVPGDAGVKIRLAPADADRLDPGAVPGSREVLLVADPSVEPGGCVVEAGTTSIDAQLGAALDRVRAFLLDGGPA